MYNLYLRQRVYMMSFLIFTRKYEVFKTLQTLVVVCERTC